MVVLPYSGDSLHRHQRPVHEDEDNKAGREALPLIKKDTEQ